MPHIHNEPITRIGADAILFRPANPPSNAK